MNAILAGRLIVGLVGGSVLIALLTAGCAGWPGNQGDPGAPIVVRGTVFNKFGVPYAGANLLLQAVDDQHVPAVQNASLVLSARFTSSFDGTFELHLAPSATLSRLAADHDGSVHFKLVASYPGEAGIPAVEFSRAVTGSGWAGTAPVFELRAPPPPPTPAPVP